MRTPFAAVAMLLLCRSLAAAPPGTPFLEPAEAFQTQFAQDFRRSKIDDSTLKTIGPKELSQPSVEGLKISVVADVLPDVERIGVAYPLPLTGDAEVRATVELLSFPLADEGYGTGVVLAVEDGVEHGGTLQFLAGDGSRPTYTAHHFTKDAEGKYDHHVTSFAAGSSEAVLRLRREGATLHYLVSEDDGLTFNELTSIEFTDRPLKVVQLYGQRGGKPNALAARLLEFSTASPQVTLRSQMAEPPPPKSWFWWIVAAAGAVVVAIASIFWRRQRA
jgi:hypothetical protein